MAASLFPVEAGHIMTFARAVGDPNPAYTGTHPIAPPTFVQASAQYDPDYPLRPTIGAPWFGSGATPSGATPGHGSASGGTGLHAEQHFTYHRPLHAGEVLAVSTRPGERWTKEGRKGGTLEFSESITEYRGADGGLVVTARAVGVRTTKVVQ